MDRKICVMVFVFTAFFLTACAPNIDSAPTRKTVYIFPEKTYSLDLEDQISSAWIPSKFAFSVDQQPNGDGSYVTEKAGNATQFGLAYQYGSYALLAHNYLEGEQFFRLEVGDEIRIIYQIGESKSFKVREILRFEAVTPDSTQSDFFQVDEQNQRISGEISGSSLFYRIYSQNNVLILQTCIANEDVSTWGRLFIIAEMIQQK